MSPENGEAKFPELLSTILWRRLDRAGHEAARLVRQSAGWEITGAAVFEHNRQPCLLNYQIRCDPAWRTTAAQIAGWVGDESIAIELQVDAAQRWYLNGKEIAGVAGCTDLDLNFSPSTNLLPIRRLELAVGQAAAVKAAWLRFPSFTLEPLDQIYRHQEADSRQLEADSRQLEADSCQLEADSYRYESGGGRFIAELKVNEAGFVLEYPNYWSVASVLIQGGKE